MLYAYYKVGDKECAPGKEWAALHHGDLICYTRGTMDKGKWIDGNVPGVRDKIAFAVVEYTDTPEWVARLTWGCAGVEAWLDEEKQVPDKGKWRARRGNIDFATLSAECGDVTLKDRWWAHGESVEPVKVVAPKMETIRDASAITFSPLRVKDLNQVSIGAFLVGPAPGDDYATFALAYADIANLTGDLTFTLNGDVTEVAVASIDENLGGFTFTTTSNDWHYGDATRGHLLSIGQNGHGFTIECEGPGTVNFSRLHGVRTIAGLNNSRTFILINNVLVAFTANIYQNMYDGGGLQGNGLLWVNVAVPIVNVWSNLAWNYSNNGFYIGPAAGNANSVYENNDFYTGTSGVNAQNNGGVFRRNAFYANGNDVFTIAGATGTNNQSDDATAADIGWAVGADNQINGDPAVDFESVLPADGAAFLRPVAGGVLVATAPFTALAANTTDIADIPWGGGGWYIGAKSRPVPVAGIQHLKSTTGISTGIGVGI